MRERERHTHTHTYAYLFLDIAHMVSGTCIFNLGSMAILAPWALDSWISVIVFMGLKKKLSSGIWMLGAPPRLDTRMSLCFVFTVAAFLRIGFGFVVSHVCRMRFWLATASSKCRSVEGWCSRNVKWKDDLAGICNL